MHSNEDPTQPNKKNKKKADLDDIKFSGGSTLIECVDDLLLCSPSYASSQEENTHLLKLLAKKGSKVSKEKITICSNSSLIFRTSILRTRTASRSRQTSWNLELPKAPDQMQTAMFSWIGRLFSQLDSPKFPLQPNLYIPC